MATLAIGGVPLTLNDGYVQITAGEPPAGITYTGPQTFAPADTTTISLTVDTGAAEAGRTVLIGVTCANPNGRTISSASFGGVSATLLEGTTGSGDDEVFLVGAVVPSGTGNQTCSITFTGSVFNIGTGAWVIRGADFPETSGGAATDTSFPFAPSLALTIPEGGAVFSIAPCNSGTTATLSVGAASLTRTIAANGPATRDVHYGDAIGLAAATANWSQSSSLCYAAGAIVFTPS